MLAHHVMCCACCVLACDDMYTTVEETAAPITWTPVTAMPTAMPSAQSEEPTLTPSTAALPTGN